jgi:hypothetical protein
MNRTTARRLLAAALVLGIAGDILFNGSAPGINVPIVVALVLLVGRLVRPAGARLDRLDLWLAPTAIVLAAFVALRADPIAAVDAVGALLFAIAAAAGLHGAAVTRRGAGGVAAVLGWGAALIAAGSAVVVVDAPADVSAPTLGPKVRAALRGVLIAVPVVLVFALLFSSADAVFERLLDDILGQRIDVGDLPQHLVVVFGIAWLVGGYLVIATGGLGLLGTSTAARTTEAPAGDRESVSPAGSPSDEGHATSGWIGSSPPAAPPVAPAARAGSTTAAMYWTAPVERPAAWPRIGISEVVVVMAAVDLLFLVFVILQVAYLFGGRDTLSVSGMTYSDYAHRGFAELVVAAALSAGLVLAFDRILGSRSLVFIGLALGLLGLTAVVLVSAGVRLAMYQAAYGWTELRFYVDAAIAWLAIGLVVIAVLLARERTRWVGHGLVVGGLIVGLGANVIDPSAFVARQNLARAVDPSLVPPGGSTGFDVRYVGSLSDDAVPEAVAALPSIDPVDRAAMREALRRRWLAMRFDPSVAGWPAWNLGRDRARTALDGLFGG